jgi:hypothetical protein
MHIKINIMLKVTLSLVLALTALVVNGASTSGKWFDHIMVVFFENAAYSEVLANPVFKNVSSQGTLLSNYYALTHPSQPNYIGTIGGSYWHIHWYICLNFTN